MRKKKVYAVVALLSVALMLPIAFSSGVVNMIGYLFSGNTATSASSSSSTPRAFVDPVKVIDETLQSGSRFTVHVNVSDVTDLFSWQINMNWNRSILNVNRIIAGEFLNRTSSANKTSSAPRYFGGLGFVMNVTNNTAGYSFMAESILEDAALGNVAGVNGSGRLVSIEFLVVGYGYTTLGINLTGTFATTLLNSTILPNGQPETITFTKTDGYFSNKIPGDVNGDRVVDILDLSTVSAHWYPGPPAGPLGYDANTDINSDGSIDILDVAIVSAYWTGPPKGPLAP